MSNIAILLTIAIVQGSMALGGVIGLALRLNILERRR